MSRLVPRSDWENNVKSKEMSGAEKEPVRLTRGFDWGEGSAPTSQLIYDKAHDVLFAGSADSDCAINDDVAACNPSDAVCPSMEQECLGTPIYSTGLTLGEVYDLIWRDAKEERSRLHAELRDHVAPALKRAAEQESITNEREALSVALDILQALQMDDAGVVKRCRL